MENAVSGLKGRYKMQVLNPGEWAKDALQLRMTPLEMKDWILRQEKVQHVAKLEGNNSLAWYFLLQGHPVIVYVEKENGEA